jgi:hypothetical protein
MQFCGRSVFFTGMFHYIARAAAPAEERRATQAHNTAAHRAARAAASAEERRATQARNTAAHRAARAPHGDFRRAAGENMPRGAFFDSSDVDPVAAAAAIAVAAEAGTDCVVDPYRDDPSIPITLLKHEKIVK